LRAGIILSHRWSFERLKNDPQQFVEQLETDPALFDPDRLRDRFDALDRLDAYFPLEDPGPTSLTARAQTLSARLEAINAVLYETIRDEIRRVAASETLFRIASQAEKEEPSTDLGYDFLDELLSGVLQFEPPGDTHAGREPDLVFYQPTPARHIFHLITLLQLTTTDVFIDLGSGLGHVPFLVSLFTAASCIGIELEPTYVDRARQCASSLNLKNITFLQQDARTVDLSRGTFFYLYTPFRGAVLDQVLVRLQQEATTRPIRICSYGPCTAAIARQSWLEPTSPPDPQRITVFASHL
jgi:hypothetical protein